MFADRSSDGWRGQHCEVLAAGAGAGRGQGEGTQSAAHTLAADTGPRALCARLRQLQAVGRRPTQLHRQHLLPRHSQGSFLNLTNSPYVQRSLRLLTLFF